jgi:hypothetical protein
MGQAKVEGNEHLLKDIDVNCVINTNVDELNKAKRLKQKRLDEERRMVTLENELLDIKQMLKQLLENK